MLPTGTNDKDVLAGEIPSDVEGLCSAAIRQDPEEWSVILLARFLPDLCVKRHEIAVIAKDGDMAHPTPHEVGDRISCDCDVCRVFRKVAAEALYAAHPHVGLLELAYTPHAPKLCLVGLDIESDQARPWEGLGPRLDEGAN